MLFSTFFSCNSFHTAWVRSGPLAMSARCPVWRKADMAGSQQSQQTSFLFDHLVGEREQPVRYRQTERLCSLDVEEEQEMRRLQYGQGSRTCTPEDLSGV